MIRRVLVGLLRLLLALPVTILEALGPGSVQRSHRPPECTGPPPTKAPPKPPAPK